MITRRLRRLMAAALVVTVGSPLVVRAQGGQPRSVDRTAVPRMNAQQREALEKRFQQRIDAIVKERLRLTDEQHGLIACTTEIAAGDRALHGAGQGRVDGPHGIVSNAGNST